MPEEPFNMFYVTSVKTKKQAFTNNEKDKIKIFQVFTPLFIYVSTQIVEVKFQTTLLKPQPPIIPTAPPSHAPQSYIAHPNPKKTHTPSERKRVRTLRSNLLEAEQESGTIHKTPIHATLNELTPQATEVNTSGSGEDNMEHQDDLTDFIPPTPYDSPLLGGYTPGSDEGRPNITELMAICTQLSNRVLALEHSKTTQDLNNLQQLLQRHLKMGYYIALKPLVKMRSEKAKEKGVAFRNVEESTRPKKILLTIDPKDKGKGIMQEPKKPPKISRKTKIQMDKELALRLHEEEKANRKNEKRQMLH
ncbi:hypothetical protein Tco_0553690 [Tanacetum coccineum]